MKTLGRSFKKLYPFKLGTTSFIYPDLYSENVRRLGPYLDEIELLFFESRDVCAMPSAYEINELARLKDECDVSYNIHLPTDVNLAATDPVERDLAIATYVKIIEMTKLLDPTTLTLHIPYEPGRPGGESLWQTYLFKGMRALLDSGVSSRLISLETLDYPPSMLGPVLEEFDLSMCLDVGHVVLHGNDPLAVFEMFKHRISIIHLHGVHQGCDHVSLDLMEPKARESVRTILAEFTGTVSLEVFAFDPLVRSLDCLSAMI